MAVPSGVASLIGWKMNCRYKQLCSRLRNFLSLGGFYRTCQSVFASCLERTVVYSSFERTYLVYLLMNYLYRKVCAIFKPTNPAMTARQFHNRQRIKYVFDKHLVFIEGAMGNKCVRSLPGVEETIGERLVDDGFLYAFQLFGQYLVLQRDLESFKFWMGVICGASPTEASDCYYALEAYDQEYCRYDECPKGERLVGAMPGIVGVIGGKLVSSDYLYAYQLYGQYLVLQRKENEFMYWMSQICGANPTNALDCFHALQSWDQGEL